MNERQAREFLDQLRKSIAGSHKDGVRPELLAYMLRDEPIIRSADLDSLCHRLAWPDFGYTSINDVKGVLDLLEEWINNAYS